jgi:hypothetical protein
MKLILTMRLYVLVILAVLLTACKHPLSIFGQGDIVERLAGTRGCTLEDFQAGSQRCTDNEAVAEDYTVSYEAIPRPGWHFVGWADGSACSADENLFSNLAYECSECTIAQQATIEPPPGWSKGPVQVALPIAALLSTPTVEGEPASADFLPDMPGDEYELIAVVRDGRLLESEGGGIMAVTEVERYSMFRYPANTRVHELTDPEGNVYILFAYEVESEDFTDPDFQSADALAGDPVPVGWRYSTRILERDLVMHADGVATVLAIRAAVTSTWQLR